MKPIVYVNADISNSYESNSIIARIRDRLKIRYLGESFIKELNLKVVNVKLPSNFHEKAYYGNLEIAKKVIRSKESSLASKAYRRLDYQLFNNFQKDLMAYGIVRSSKLILRVTNKSIRDSCIVIYDAADDMNFHVICNMAKEARYIVLLSENIGKINTIGEYIIANYGIAPIITSDKEYAFKSADFIISSKGIDVDSKVAIWHLNNIYIPQKSNQVIVNDVTYNVPWRIRELDMSPELLGSILCQMEEKDVEKSLQYNGIFLDKVKFNEDILELD